MQLKERLPAWAVCTALILGAGTVRADGFVALYEASWAGLQAADIRIESHAEGGHYQDAIELHSKGLPRLLVRFDGTATSEGRLADRRGAEPARYDTVYDLRERQNSHISMRFVERGGAVVADRGPDDTGRKPPLAEKFRRNVVDPLSALEAIRWALRGSPAASFAVPVYDGARRFDVLGRLANRGQGTLRAEVSLRPIAGFKGETSEDGDPDDAPRTVELSFTDDGRFVPLSMTVPIWYLPLVVRLVRLCNSGEECR